MNPSDSVDPNPYQSPSTISDPENEVVGSGIKGETIKCFREQMHALGALWIIIGIAAVSAVAIAVQRVQAPGMHNGHALFWFAATSVPLGVVWFILGLFVCLKQMVAVYAGLVLSYILLAIYVIVSVAILSLIASICPITFLLLVIFQAHRVINMANTLRAANVPLDTKPNC